MIPLPEMLSEVIMALGGALLAANGYALYRSRRPEQPAAKRPVQARGRVIANMLIGLVVFSWGLATFLVRRSG